MNGTLTGTRATARIAPTIYDELAILPATGHDSPGPLFNEATETPAPEDIFATAPMKATRLEFDWQREEEAYTSFEAAISDRVLALQGRHIGVNERRGAGTRGSVQPAMSILAGTAAVIWHKLCSAQVWRHGLRFAGIGLMLMLAGFDLMGLLVLHAR